MPGLLRSIDRSKIVTMRFLLPSLLFLLAPAAFCQPITTGTWTGTLQWSNANPVPLSVDIETCAEGLKLSLSSADQHYRTATTVVSTSWPMMFDIRNTARDYTLACSLNRNDAGELAGICSSGSSRARLSLIPPDVSTIGCSE